MYKNLNYPAASAFIQKEKPLILDVRTPAEFQEGFIEGALLIPVQQLSSRMGELSDNKDKPILVYCRSGSRSVSASEMLSGSGFKKVYNLEGGISAWSRDGGSVTR